MADDSFTYRLLRSFPSVEFAVGFFVCGDGLLLPKECWLRISKIENEKFEQKCKIQDEKYDFDLTFYTPNHDGTIGLNQELIESGQWKEPGHLDYTPGEYADRIMESLNLESPRKMSQELSQEQSEETQKFYTELAEESQEYKIKMELDRRTFENCYRLVANSTYVQLSENPKIRYIMREPQDEKDRYRMLDYFYSSRPWETLEPEPVVPTIRPLVASNQDIIGMITYRPFSIILFNDAEFIVMQK